ncbi:MAG: lipocalin family protein [Pseudomonadota bacterium]
MTRFRQAIALLVLSPLLFGCASSKFPDMQTVDYVDLDRFMGDWYVIANIPTFIEKGAHNAVETYAMNDDGTVDTVFNFRKDGFDGKAKRYNPKGFIQDDTNALWGMRFIWPIKADYRIVYLDDDYSVTIIGRQKRDFVWLMARSPQIDEPELQRLLGIIEDLGYDMSKVTLVPQQWPEAGS